MAIFVPLKSGICMAALVCATGLYYWGHCCIISVSGDAPSVLGYVYICNSGRASIITQIQNWRCSQKWTAVKKQGAHLQWQHIWWTVTQRSFADALRCWWKQKRDWHFLDFYCISISCTSSEIAGLWFIDGLKEQFERGVQKVFNLCQ